MDPLRKIKPIYDAIDARNYKGALKLCNQFLTKEKGSDHQKQIVSVLKAYALERSGKKDDALDICKQVKSSVPTDENVLYTLSQTLKNLSLMEEISEVYEKAYAKTPKEDILIGLFNSYVRRGEIQKQSQTAMKLWKQYSNDKYLFWSIMSSALQGDQNPTLMQVAERMMDKLYSEKKIDKVELLEFYIDIYVRQKNFKKAIEILSNSESLYKIAEDKLRLKAQLYLNANEIKEAHQVFVELITQMGVDDWTIYQNFLDTGFQLDAKDSSGQLKQLIEDVQKKDENKRGPFLILMEYYDRLGDYSKIPSLLISYFDKFGKLSCCFGDMKKYLQCVEKDAQNFVDTLLATIPKRTDDEDTKKNYIFKKITFYQISRRLGLLHKLNQSTSLELSNSILEEYEYSIKGEVKEPTEFSRADGFILIASTLIHQNVTPELCLSDQIQLVIASILVLERALIHSKYNFQVRLQLILLYSFLGCVAPENDHFSALDVKHILADTLSYLIFDDSISLAFPSITSQISDSIQFLHDDNSQTTPDMIVKAFSHLSFSRIREFIKFKERLENSHQIAISNVEKVFLKLQKYENPLEAQSYLMRLDSSFPLSDEKLNKLTLNQDYDVISNWDPDNVFSIFKVALPVSSSANTLHRSKQEQLQWLKIRSFIPVLLLASIKNDANKLKAYLETFQQCLENLGFLSKDTDFGGKTCSFELHTCTLLTQLFQLSLILIESNNDPSKFKTFIDEIEIFQKLFLFIQEYLINKLTKSDEGKETFNPFALRELTHFISYYSWIVLIFQVWLKLLPTGKKKSEEVLKVKSCLKEFLGKLKTCATELKNKNNIMQQSIIIHFDSTKIPIKFKANEISSVLEKVKSSWTSSLVHLQALVDPKIQLLQKLRV